MKYRDFEKQIGLSMFSTEQAGRVLPSGEREQLNVQLSRWLVRGEIARLRRGLYVLQGKVIDEVVLSNYVYQPSYVSLETVLNLTGIMPDISAVVTAVTTLKPQRFETPQGIFVYSKIARELYFGYQLVVDNNSGLTYRIASPEKALFDYVYVRRIRDLSDTRISWELLNKSKLNELIKIYPAWVGKVIKKYV